MIVGYSGTGKAGHQYHYYNCKNARKKKCKKKIVSEQYLEDRIIAECLKLLTDENIAFIAKMMAKECSKAPDNLSMFTYKKGNWYGTLLYYQNQDTFNPLASYAVTHPEMDWTGSIPDLEIWIPEEPIPASIADARRAYGTLITKVTGWHNGEIRVFETGTSDNRSGVPGYAVSFFLYDPLIRPDMW